MTARAKGLREQHVLYGHVFRNAMLLVIAGFPAAFVGILFTGALLAEVIFRSMVLAFWAGRPRSARLSGDVRHALYCFRAVGSFDELSGDVTYMLVDPRIDFEGRGVSGAFRR